MKKILGAAELALEQGDITRFAADAVVNAANSSLLGGGGVDGAIHRAGGPSILEECKKLRAVMPRGCPPGQAVITTAGNLPAKHVIHTVGPIWRTGNQNEPKILADCYSNSLSLALEHGLKTIAFPSVSTGAYGYPTSEAAKVAVSAVRRFVDKHHGGLTRITWVLFDRKTFDAYRAALAE
jgi:O-acetyl-ADP-ribose deacetylase (regulator of RNase III)